MTDNEQTPKAKPGRKSRVSYKVDNITALYGIPINDVQNGALFTTRRELAIAKVHRPTRKTLDIGPYGVISAILSNDEFVFDCWKRIIYEAPLVEIPKTSKKTKNKLCKNIDGFKLSYLNQRPIRLIRSHEHKGGLGPKEGYRYDGLFLVTYFWETVVDKTHTCHRYELHYDLTTQKYIPPPELHLRSNIDSNVINIAENKEFYSCVRIQGENNEDSGRLINSEDSGRLINSEVKDDDLSISFVHISRDQKRDPNPPIVKTETIKEEINENSYTCEDIENKTCEDNEMKTCEDIEMKTCEDIDVKMCDDIENKMCDDIQFNEEIEIKEDMDIIYENIEIETCKDVEIKTSEIIDKTDEGSNEILGYRIYNWPEELEPEEIQIEEIEINTDNPVNPETYTDTIEISDDPEDSDEPIEIPFVQNCPKLKIRRIRLRKINRKYKSIIDYFLVVRNQKFIKTDKCEKWKACVYDMNFSRFINLISKEKICPCSWRSKFKLLSIEMKALSQYIIYSKDSDSVMVKICKKSPHMRELIINMPVNEIECNSHGGPVINQLISQLKAMIVKFPILCLNNCSKIVKQKTISNPEFLGFQTDMVSSAKGVFGKFKILVPIMQTNKPECKTYQEKPGCSKTPVIIID